MLNQNFATVSMITFRTVLVMSLCVMLSISACGESRDANVNGDQIIDQHETNHKSEQNEGDLNIQTDVLPEYDLFYEPLTLQKLQAIRSGNDDFCKIRISYGSRTDLVHYGHRNIRTLSLTAGFAFNQYDYSMIDEYKGVYVHNDREIPLVTSYERTFTIEEVDSILDCIENNPAFFFNHEEFNGQNSLLTLGSHFCYGGRYKFTLRITNPIFLTETWQEQHEPSWGISKCIDEYPAPDHPLYDLFEILENDFISQFEP